MSADPFYRPRLRANIRIRALWTMIALLVAGTIALIQIVLTLLIAFDRAESVGRMSIYLAITFWFTVVAVVTLILFIVWLSGAHSNLEVFRRASRHRLVATILWWFVPIANLFMPYRVTADIQSEMIAVGNDDWQDRDPVKWWWATLVGGLVVYLVIIQVNTPPGEIAWPLIIESVAWGSLLVASYFAIRLIRRITGLQLDD